MGGLRLQQFTALRAKCYSFTFVEEDRAEAERQGINTKRSKGVSRPATARMTHENYNNALFNNTKLYTKMTTIQSKKHQLYTFSISKLALNSADDKRYILPDRINTLPYGHRDIKNL